MFLLFEKQSAENLARLGGAGPAEEPDGTGYSPPLIVRGAKRRELPTAGTKTHEVVLAPARTVKGVTKSSRFRSNSKGGNGRHFYCSRVTTRELKTVNFYRSRESRRDQTGQAPSLL